MEQVVVVSKRQSYRFEKLNRLNTTINPFSSCLYLTNLLYIRMVLYTNCSSPGSDDYYAFQTISIGKCVYKRALLASALYEHRVIFTVDGLITGYFYSCARDLF